MWRREDVDVLLAAGITLVRYARVRESTPDPGIDAMCDRFEEAAFASLDDLENEEAQTRVINAARELAHATPGAGTEPWQDL